jgi:signal peptidase I
MVPTLQVRDALLVDEIAYRLHPPAPGDVAVFTPPVDSSGEEYVKRVIGVPGDTIAIVNGIVYRNGAALREPYENQPPRYSLAVRAYEIYVDGRPLDPRAANVPAKALWQAPNRIPKGFYFVLGDNRNYSDDSHVWGFAQTGGVFAAGPLAGRNVRARFAGRAFLIWWPLDRLRVLER